MTPDEKQQIDIRKENREHANRAHDRFFDDMSTTNSATMDAGVVAVRSLFLINGGAAVAVLAFLANILNSDQAAGVDGVSEALMTFAIGVALASAAACGTYLTNFCYVSQDAKKMLTWDHPYIENTKASMGWFRAGRVLHVITVLAAFGSLGSFLWGVKALTNSFEPIF